MVFTSWMCTLQVDLVVAKTLTGFWSRNVTHVTLPFCLNKLSPLLSCYSVLFFFSDHKLLLVVQEWLKLVQFIVIS